VRLGKAIGQSMNISRETQKEVLDFLKTIVWFVLLFFGLRMFVVEGFEIQGTSMEPTLRDNERLFVLKFVYRFEEIHRGDIVVFRYPNDVSRRFIKRVIGLPGDTVQVLNGKVIVNGDVIEEPYLGERRARSRENLSEVVVPEDSYYVLGDHRSISSDSRGGWFVPRELIIGKAALRFWPLREFTVL
jgi:signal peptidase I